MPGVATFIVLALVISGAGAVTAIAMSRMVGWLWAVTLAVVVGAPALLGGDPILPVALAGAALIARRWVRRGIVAPAAFDGFAVQFAFIAAGYGLYALTRIGIEPSADGAILNSRDVVELERSLGLFFERHLQELLARGPLKTAWNAIYLFGYWPLPITALLLFYLRDRTAYRILRTSLLVSASLALLTFAVYPVAPPRLTPGIGIEDTIANGRVVSNQFAAIPSLHAGWPVLVGLLVFIRARGWVRYAALVPGPLMTVTIIVTGNHYWVDAAVGIAYSVVPALALLALDRMSDGSGVRERRVARSP